MKTYIKFVLTCLIVSLIFAPKIQAQNKDEEMVKKQLMNFTQAFSEFVKKKDKNIVLKYMTDDASATITYVDLNSGVKSKFVNYEAFKRRLDEFINTGEVKSYSNISIHRIKINGNIAVANLSTNVSLSQEGQVLINGSQIVTFILKKINNIWKIYSYSLTETTDEKHKGDCFCTLFKKGTSAYASKLRVPAGSNYSDFLDVFSFQKEGNNTVIIAGDKTYKWVEGTNIYEQNEIGDTTTLLGKARTAEEAVIVILQKSIYKENCLDVVLKK